MNFFRRISLPAHAFVELTVGLALVVAPLVFMLGGLGTILTFSAGVLLAGMGFGAVETLSLATHQSLDRMLSVVLAAASIAVALWGEPLPALLLLIGAFSMLALNSATKWTRTPTTRGAHLP